MANGFLTSASSTEAGAVTVPAGLEADWRFDEETGISAYDTATGGSHQDTGTLSGTPSPTWTTGVIGNVLQFNGSSTYVSVNYTSDLQLSSNMSIALWAKSTNSGNWGNTSGKGVGDFIIQPITGSNGGFFLGANDSTTKQVDFKVYIGGTLESINISPTTINTWNYYVATCSYSGSSTTMSLSVNGGTPNTATYSGA